MRKIILGVASLLLLAGEANATSIGYSKETISRLNTFRVGTSTTQGQAIRLSKAKLQALKGKTIDFAEFVVGSKQTTGNVLNAFVTTSLGGEPVAKGAVAVSRAYTKCKWTLDKPYTITGDEECLYVGYTAEIPNTYKLLMSDGSCDISGCNFAYKDGEWVDTYGMNKGSAHITFNVEGAGDYTDVAMGRSNFDGYFKAGNNYDFTARLVNIGTTVVNSFDAELTVGGNTSTQHFSGISVNPKDVYSFKLTGIDAEDEGAQDVSVTVTNVNGGSGETDASDNNIGGSLYFYPHDMERSLFVESFTGQDCPQCPGGHTNIVAAINSFDGNIVEMTHHSGYQPDMFTMAEDDFARFFYSDPAHTYAPAVMVNRYTCDALSSAPVIQIDGSESVTALLSYAALAKPYVSLNLETKFDESTRELTVKLQMKPHTQLPSDNTLFNVYLVQDGLTGYQSNGGTNYTHNRVCRGAITGNSWGILADNLTPGEATTWETTIVIPDSIHSSYWTDDLLSDVETKNGTVQMYGEKYLVSQTNIEAVAKNMSVVAFVGQYDSSDNTKNIVYNCCEAKLGESYRQAGFGTSAGVEGVEAKPEVGVSIIGGKVCVSGNYDRLNVYNVDGRQVDAGSVLAKGVYVVKVAEGGKQTTKKVLVR